MERDVRQFASGKVGDLRLANQSFERRRIVDVDRHGNQTGEPADRAELRGSRPRALGRDGQITTIACELVRSEAGDGEYRRDEPCPTVPADPDQCLRVLFVEQCDRQVCAPRVFCTFVAEVQRKGREAATIGLDEFDPSLHRRGVQRQLSRCCSFPMAIIDVAAGRSEIVVAAEPRIVIERNGVDK